MRKPFWIFLLPLLLLFAQHAEAQHEYEHYADQATSCSKPAPVHTCLVCLAYAHLAQAAKPEATGAALQSNLSFHFAPAARVASAGADEVLPRSRGPPSL